MGHVFAFASVWEAKLTLLKWFWTKKYKELSGKCHKFSFMTFGTGEHWDGFSVEREKVSLHSGSCRKCGQRMPFVKRARALFALLTRDAFSSREGAVEAADATKTVCRELWRGHCSMKLKTYKEVTSALYGF